MSCDRCPELERAIGRLEGKVDGLIDLLKTRRDEAAQREQLVDGKLSAFDSRLRVVEGRQHWYAGAAAVVAAIGSAVMSRVLPHFGHS